MKSEKRSTKQKVVSAVTIASTVGVTGCSYLAPQPDAASDSKSFRATASTNTMPAALPVDIADDIKRIANGQLVESNGAWQQATGEVPQGAPSSFEPTEGTGAPNAPVRYRSRRPAQAGRSGTQGDGKPGTYVVKPGDTLMKISFEKYGDLYRWREILEANKGRVKNYSSLPVGMTLAINDVEYVVIERDGKPYLIRKSDTLAKISASVYGKASFWKNIWHNNPQLIQNPNKIYAGFTLYYRDPSEFGDIRVSKNTSAPERKASKNAQVLPEKAAAPAVAPVAPAVAAPVVAAPAPAAPSDARVPAASEGWAPKSTLSEDPLKDIPLPPPQEAPAAVSPTETK